MRRSPYGKKGGTSINAGRVAILYVAMLPDGTTVKKRSYAVNTPTAYLGCYKDEHGRWHASGIADQPKDWGGQTFVTARRITP